MTHRCMFHRTRALTAAVDVTEVGESPDIAEPDRVAQTGQDELDGAAPRTPVVVGRHRLYRRASISLSPTQ